MNGFGLPWAPGASEFERFREDLYLRIGNTAAVMSQALDHDANMITTALQRVSGADLLHPDRADHEEAKLADIAEHERFVYNWALVMLTTRTIDALKHLARLLDKLMPPYERVGKSELLRVIKEYRERCSIELADAPTGTEFLAGMVLARNKIVHNESSLYELSSDPNPILIEGDAPWQPDAKDQDFAQRYPEYVEGKRITVTKTIFEARAQQSLDFLAYATERYDQFVQLLTSTSNAGVN